MAIRKIEAGRINTVTAAEYVGQKGVIFYDEDIGAFRLSDGSTIGGIPLNNSSSVDPEAEMAYAKRTDFISDNLIYRGEAVPGTATSASAWRIHRLILAEVDGDVTEEWAGGNALFDKVWDDRLTLSYS